MVLPTLFSALCVLQSHFIQFLPLRSNTYPSFPLLLLTESFTSRLCGFFFIPISSAADKEVDDYYTRKRHLPDLAARGTLPLHVLKISQDQVGAQLLVLIVNAAK